MSSVNIFLVKILRYTVYAIFNHIGIVYYPRATYNWGLRISAGMNVNKCYKLFVFL